MKIRPNRTALICLALYGLNLLLNVPLFLPGEAVYPESAEGGYATIAQWFVAHPNPWGWYPLQGCGLPARYTGLPLLAYSAALISWITHVPSEYAWRLLTAALACFAPVALFLMVRYFTRGRTGWALAAALAYTFFSPAYGLIGAVDLDRGVAYLPWRLQVLAKYGEAPHSAALALLPLVLIAVHRAATRRGFFALFAAAIAITATALLSSAAAIAAAIALLVMVLAAVGEPGFDSMRVLKAGLLGYLLAAFWLTPSFIRTTASPVWKPGPPAALAAGLIALRLVLRFTGGAFYTRFLALALAAFAILAALFYGHNVEIFPGAFLNTLEFELFLILALAEFVRLGVAEGSGTVTRLSAVLPILIMLIAGRAQPIRYVTQGWSVLKPSERSQSAGYRLARWLEAQHPAGRVLLPGSLRYRWNVWSALPQASAAFDAGIANRLPRDLVYQIRTGEASAAGKEGRDAIGEMRAMDVEYLAVREGDLRSPARFDGLIERVYTAEGYVVYRVPCSGYAHLVRDSELPTQAPNQGRVTLLDPLTAAFDDPARPRLTSLWESAGRLRIGGPVPQGMLVATSVNAAPGWSATQDGAPVPVETNALGFLTVRPRPTAPVSAVIVLQYRAPKGARLMAGLSAVGWMLSLVGLYRARRRDPIERIGIEGRVLPT
jgi:hypothetical protein